MPKTATELNILCPECGKESNYEERLLDHESGTGSIVFCDKCNDPFVVENKKTTRKITNSVGCLKQKGDR